MDDPADCIFVSSFASSAFSSGSISFTSSVSFVPIIIGESGRKGMVDNWPSANLPPMEGMNFDELRLVVLMPSS